jgi:hypothetical protein
MRKNLNGLLGMYAIAASMSGIGNDLFADPREKRVYIEKEKRPYVPTGSKEYFFNEQGEFSTERMRKDETVFKCIAINDKNAIRKFERWKINRA